MFHPRLAKVRRISSGNDYMASCCQSQHELSAFKKDSRTEVLFSSPRVIRRETASWNIRFIWFFARQKRRSAPIGWNTVSDVMRFFRNFYSDE